MNTAQPTVWTGTVSDEQQAKVPWVVGVALVLGVFLWMGPYMGVNVVLLPAKTALLAGDGKASVVAVLSTSAMIVAAKFAISGFQLYILTDYMMQSADGAKHYVSVISMCMMVTAIAMTVIAGPISDRIGSRKIPVIACSLLVAVGSIIPFFSNDPKMMIAYALVAGTGMGAYNAVDQALNVEVLPSKDTAAKDLGILNLANTGGQVLGPVLAATLINMFGYHALFPLAAVCSLLGALLIVFIKSVK